MKYLKVGNSGMEASVVGRAICSRRDKVILATKCGLWWPAIEPEQTPIADIGPASLSQVSHVH